MLDMGFEPQIRTIMARVPRGYQSLMYTAACSARGAAPQAAPSLTPVESSAGDLAARGATARLRVPARAVPGAAGES